MSSNAHPKRERSPEVYMDGSPATKKPKTMPIMPDFNTPTEMVTIIAGKEGEDERFIVHKEFACHYSPVLKAAFESSFIEGRTQCFLIKGVSARVIRLLLCFFYTGKVDTSLQRYISAGFEAVADQQMQQEIDFIHFWVLADRLLIPSLQNAIVRELEIMWNLPTDRALGVDWIPFVYGHTSVDSPLRALTLDHCAYGLPSEMFLKDPAAFPHEMLLDLARLMSSGITPTTTYEKDKYGYNNVKRPRYTYKRTWGSYHVPEGENS